MLCLQRIILLFDEFVGKKWFHTYIPRNPLSKKQNESINECFTCLHIMHKVLNNCMLHIFYFYLHILLQLVDVDL